MKLGKPWFAAPIERVESADTREKREEVVMRRPKMVVKYNAVVRTPIIDARAGTVFCSNRCEIAAPTPAHAAALS